MHQHAVTVAAALLLLSGAACAQTFDADAAVGIEIDEANLVEPGAENVDAEEASGIDPAAPGPAVELLRQDLVTVGPFIRTCPCTRVRNLVRPLSVDVCTRTKAADWCLCSPVCFVAQRGMVQGVEVKVNLDFV